MECPHLPASAALAATLRDLDEAINGQDLACSGEKGEI